jgi:hypothetical protein
MTAIDLALIDSLTGGFSGTFDVACPLCGPQRRSPVNRKRKVLRIYRVDEGFAGFHCARCGEQGHARDASASRPDPEKLARIRAEAAERERDAAAERLQKAKWLWSQRRPIIRSLAERYLREARDCHGPLPATLGFLPARSKYSPAMIAAFGIPIEPEPGVLLMRDEEIRGIHITRLAPDGSGKADVEPNKIMIGHSKGWPIVLAPVNDLLGLAITEGIEDGLSVFAATGLGVWVAGNHSRMPALADVIPSYVECVTVYAHDDDDGQKYALELARLLDARGIEVFTEGVSATGVFEGRPE